MNRLVERHGERVGAGFMRGSLYDLGGYPGASATPKKNSVVRGEVYSLENPEEALRELDRYEGVDPSDPNGSEFRRVLKLVRLSSGRNTRAWVYLYNQPTEGRLRIDSGDYESRRRLSSSR